MVTLRKQLLPVFYCAALCCALSVLHAKEPANTYSTKKTIGQFSFGAPTGWQLEASDEINHYWLHHQNQSGPRCSIELRAESAPTPADAQSLRAVRMRSGLIDAREDEIRRGELNSVRGMRILKIDLRYGPERLGLHLPLAWPRLPFHGSYCYRCERAVPRTIHALTDPPVCSLRFEWCVPCLAST